jgi:hypothetical protein
MVLLADWPFDRTVTPMVIFLPPAPFGTGTRHTTPDGVTAVLGATG